MEITTLSFVLPTLVFIAASLAVGFNEQNYALLIPIPVLWFFSFFVPWTGIPILILLVGAAVYGYKRNGFN